jgi:hypothetical protein
MSEHLSKIELVKARKEHADKQGSVFIFDKDMGVWFYEPEYRKMQENGDDNFNHIPYLTEGQLDQFGLWSKVN